MLKMKTHSVVYKNLVWTNREKLALYHKNANIAACAMTEFFLDLFGGINQADLRNSIYDTSMKSEQEAEDVGEKDEEISVIQRPETYPDAVLLFLHWFTLEDVEGANSNIALDVPEVMPRFLFYLKEQKVDIDPRWHEIMEATVKSAEFLAGEGSKKVQDRTWVDRRRGHQHLVRKTGLKVTTLQWLLDDDKFILQEKKVDSNTYARDFISINWGDGEKSDWNLAQNKIYSLQSFVKNTLQENDSEKMRLLCCDFLGISPGLEPREISCRFAGKKGRPSKLFNFLGGERKVDDREGLSEIIAEGLDRSDHMLRRPKDNEDFWVSAQKQLEKAINLPFHPAFWNEFMGMALRRIRGTRKIVLNMVITRYMLDRTDPCVPEWLSEKINLWCDEHQQPHLWSGDVGGFREVEEVFTGNYAATVVIVEKNSRNRRLNFPFMKMIGELLDAHPQENALSVIGQIRKYQVYTKNNHDFWRLRSPRLARFTNFSEHPCWGESRPDIKYLGTDGNMHHYQCDILTHNGVEVIKTVVVNKRATRDLFAQPNHPLMTEEDIKKAGLMGREAEERKFNWTYEVDRRNKLTAMLKNKDLKSLVPCILEEIKVKGKKSHKKIVTIEGNSGVKLFMKDKDRPYLYVTFDLPVIPTLPLDELRKLKAGWRFLSFDPGIRTNITYCVGEIIRCRKTNAAYQDSNGNFVIPIANVNDEFVGVRILEHGALKEKDFKREDKRTICRFESDVSADVCPDAKNFWSELEKAGLVTKECPPKMGGEKGFIGSAIYILKNQMKGKKEKPDLSLVKRLTELLKYNSHNSGHLSYARISNLKFLKGLYQLCIKKSGIADPWLEESLEYVTNKIRNVREDRFRRLPNMVCQLAIKHQVKVVFPESTGLSVHQKASKWLMRQVDSWTPMRVLAQCRAQLVPLGIYVFGVWSNYSSHIDFSCDGECEKPRYKILNGEQVKEEIEYYESLKGKLSITKGLYRRSIYEWLVNKGASWEDWKEKIDFSKIKKEYFPCKGGEWYQPLIYQADGKWMNADDQAAIFLLKRGLRELIKPRKVKKKKGFSGRRPRAAK